MKRKIRKLALLAAGVALVAMALPAMASAAQIWEEGTPDKLLPVPSDLSAEGRFEIENGMLGTWGCDEVSLDAELTENKPESMWLAGRGGSAEACEAGGGQGTTVEEFTIVDVNTTKPGEGEITLAFHWLIGPWDCGYQGIGTFSYESGTNIIDLDVPIESWTSEMCEPEEGESVMHGKFTLRTESGAKALLIDPPAAPAALFNAATLGNTRVSMSPDPSALRQVFHTIGYEWECYSLGAEGTALHSSPEITLGNVQYGQCEEFEVHFNGCQYKLHAGIYEGEGASSGSVDLQCPTGKAAEIDWPNRAESVCNIKMPPQSGLQGLEFESAGGEPQKLRATAHLTGVEYIMKGPEGVCETGSYDAGTYDGTFLVSATTDDEAEEAVGLEVALSE